MKSRIYLGGALVLAAASGARASSWAINYNLSATPSTNLTDAYLILSGGVYDANQLNIDRTSPDPVVRHAAFLSLINEAQNESGNVLVIPLGSLAGGSPQVFSGTQTISDPANPSAVGQYVTGMVIGQYSGGGGVSIGYDSTAGANVISGGASWSSTDIPQWSATLGVTSYTSQYGTTESDVLTELQNSDTTDLKLWLADLQQADSIILPTYDDVYAGTTFGAAHDYGLSFAAGRAIQMVDYSTAGDGGSATLTVSAPTAVPEPGALGLASMGGLALLKRQRRRN